MADVIGQLKNLHTVEPLKNNHPGEIPKVVALLRLLLFGGGYLSKFDCINVMFH